MKERMISRGDLFYYDFGERVGSVQSGERPVLVVQADDYNKRSWQHLFSTPLAERIAHGKPLRNRLLICIIGF